MAKIEGKTNSQVPWANRVYGINRSSTRTQKQLEAGMSDVVQYVVTIPPELASQYDPDQGFTWVQIGSNLMLVPTEKQARRTRKLNWTPEQDAVVLREDLSLREAAELTGKTRDAVGSRRWYLRKMAK